jgi:periplasmic copper chaperone A
MQPSCKFTMRNSSVVGVSTALLLGFAAAVAASPAYALFVVNQPWIHPAQVAQSTEAYMDLTSTEGARLVGVRSDVAKSVSIRVPGGAPGENPRITLPPKVLVPLAPGRYRIALIQLLRTLKLGDRVELTLTIERDDGSRQEIPVNAEVRQHSPIDEERRAHSHAHPTE